MEPLKVMATIDDSLYEVEVKQPDPKLLNFQVFQDGKPIGVLHKENDQWYSDGDTCLIQDDVEAIGKAVDRNLKEKA